MANLYHSVKGLCSNKFSPTMKHNGRKLWVLAWFTFVVLCFMMFSNNYLWDCEADPEPVADPLVVGIARKLLEEEEMAINDLNSTGKLAKRLPQGIIVGVRKCGTRALLEFLGLHPDIKVAYHEIHYFDNHYDKGIEWYKNEMPLSYKNQITIEKSPRYFVAEDVPQRIQLMNKSMKLIFVLRDPTTRVISDFTQGYYKRKANKKPILDFKFHVLNQKTGEINSNFKAVNISTYHSHFERWLQYFPLEQMHLVDGDNLIHRPWEEVEKVEKFLGVQHFLTKDNFVFNNSKGFHCMRTASAAKCLSETKGRTHISTSPVIVNQLNEYFKPYNEILYSMFNRTFGWN